MTNGKDLVFSTIQKGALPTAHELGKLVQHSFLPPTPWVAKGKMRREMNKWLHGILMENKGTGACLI